MACLLTRCSATSRRQARPIYAFPQNSADNSHSTIIHCLKEGPSAQPEPHQDGRRTRDHTQRQNGALDLVGGLAGSQPPRNRHYAHADRKSTRLNSSHLVISYAVFCWKKKKDTPMSGPGLRRPRTARPEATSSSTAQLTLHGHGSRSPKWASPLPRSLTYSFF